MHGLVGLYKIPCKYRRSAAVVAKGLVEYVQQSEFAVRASTSFRLPQNERKSYTSGMKLTSVSGGERRLWRWHPLQGHEPHGQRWANRAGLPEGDFAGMHWVHNIRIDAQVEGLHSGPSRMLVSPLSTQHALHVVRWCTMGM